jgi:anti-sigma B factor antagonist
MTPEASAIDEYSRIRIDRDRAHGADIVMVGGDVDLHSAPELRERLEWLSNDEDASRIVVDLSEATFLDSMALGVLLAAKRSAEARGKRFMIVSATTEIRRIFEITMLDSVFELHATRDGALEDAEGLEA